MVMLHDELGIIDTLFCYNCVLIIWSNWKILHPMNAPCSWVRIFLLNLIIRTQLQHNSVSIISRIQACISRWLWSERKIKNESECVIPTPGMFWVGTRQNLSACDERIIDWNLGGLWIFIAFRIGCPWSLLAYSGPTYVTA